MGRGGLRPRGPAPRLPQGKAARPCGRPPGELRVRDPFEAGRGIYTAVRIVFSFPAREIGGGSAVPPGRSTAGLELARTRGIRPFN